MSKDPIKEGLLIIETDKRTIKTTEIKKTKETGEEVVFVYHRIPHPP